jgi:SAM-dependent methyltransferase
MCNAACLEFGRSHLTRQDVLDKKVIEVGSLDVNGSLRADLERLGSSSYLGVDVAEGPGVDEICDITELENRYGGGSFDVVVSTEVLEHVRDWRRAVVNLKRILKPGGVLLLTTRSKGFPYHGYPHDFWRFEVDDIQAIMSDLVVDSIATDPLSPGVFVKARKPAPFCEKNLDAFPLFSIVNNKRCVSVTEFEILLRRCKYRLRLLLTRILPPRAAARIIGALSSNVRPDA